MKKPTKKELREKSDRHLLTDYDLAASAADRAIHAKDLLPGYSSQVERIKDDILVVVDALRSEILRRMGGGK